MGEAKRRKKLDPNFGKIPKTVQESGLNVFLMGDLGKNVMKIMAEEFCLISLEKNLNMLYQIVVGCKNLKEIRSKIIIPKNKF